MVLDGRKVTIVCKARNCCRLSFADGTSNHAVSLDRLGFAVKWDPKAGDFVLKRDVLESVTTALKKEGVDVRVEDDLKRKREDDTSQIKRLSNEGKSCSEIAEQLNIRVADVWKHLA